jgi:hypothetical protein
MPDDKDKTPKDQQPVAPPPAKPNPKQDVELVRIHESEERKKRGKDING